MKMKMDYKVFVEAIARRLPDYIEELGEIEVKVTNVQKLQNDSYYGIVVNLKEGKRKYGICINPEPLYEQYREDEIYFLDAYERVVDEIISASAKAPEIDVDSYLNYSNVRERLTIQLIGIAGNDYLADIPHLVIEDMAVVYRIVVDHSDNFASVLITDDMMHTWDITKEQLHEDAVSSAMQRYPASLRSMREVLADMMGVEVEMLPDTDEMPLYVATSSPVNGAACLVYEGFLQSIAKKVGGNYYVLPSSIHEFLVVPDSREIDKEALNAMVCDINATEVSVKDKLTDSIYHYNAENCKFEKVCGSEQLNKKGA